MRGGEDATTTRAMKGVNEKNTECSAEVSVAPISVRVSGKGRLRVLRVKRKGSTGLDRK